MRLKTDDVSSSFHIRSNVILFDPSHRPSIKTMFLENAAKAILGKHHTFHVVSYHRQWDKLVRPFVITLSKPQIKPDSSPVGLIQHLFQARKLEDIVKSLKSDSLLVFGDPSDNLAAYIAARRTNKPLFQVLDHLPKENQLNRKLILQSNKVFALTARTATGVFSLGMPADQIASFESDSGNDSRVAARQVINALLKANGSKKLDCFLVPETGYPC